MIQKFKFNIGTEAEREWKDAKGPQSKAQWERVAAWKSKGADWKDVDHDEEVATSVERAIRQAWKAWKRMGPCSRENDGEGLRPHVQGSCSAEDSEVDGESLRRQVF